MVEPLLNEKNKELNTCSEQVKIQNLPESIMDSKPDQEEGNTFITYVKYKDNSKTIERCDNLTSDIEL